MVVPGDGRRGARRIEVKIPAGVRDGSKLRIAGEGAHAPGGGPSGDLYLVVRLRPHPVFEVRGDDLWTVVPVSVYDAVLGGRVVVPTIAGRAEMTIPAETQNDQVFRLREQGLPSLRGGPRGDEMVRVRVDLPRGLSPQERKLFGELASLRRGPR
jgi:DnaJ-class molecular chaperone